MRLLAFFLPALVLGLTAALVALPIQAAGKVIYVDASASCPGSGVSYQPFCNIQSGINAASLGDTVQVAAGTYLECIIIGSGVVIQGEGQDVTIIDGAGCDNQVVRTVGLDSSARIDGFSINNGSVGMYNESSSPTVTNCTFSGSAAGMGNESSSPSVTNCTFSGSKYGMYNYQSSPMVTNCTFSGSEIGMYNSQSSLTVTNCTFSGISGEIQIGYVGMFNFDSSSPTVTNCTFSGFLGLNLLYPTQPQIYNGGGMTNIQSSPTVTNCTFSANSADSGGGMYNYYGSSPTVTNCTFSKNSALAYGGGMTNIQSSPTVTNCTFSKNSADSGGGMFNDFSSPTVTNCTFSKNSALAYGGGMYNDHDSSPTVTNCTFSKNSAEMHGGGMYNYQSSPTVTNCIFWGDVPNEICNFSDESPVVTYSDIQGSYEGTGNINEDPLFADAATDDFHLQQGSPCIDAGTNEAPALPDTDFEGDPRIVDGNDDGTATAEMGADECAPPTADFAASFTSGVAPLSVNFTDRSMGNITSWLWDFGDDSTSTERNPRHTYTDSGIYTVTLAVTGSVGSDTEIKSKFINARPRRAMPWIPLLLED